MTNIFEFCSVIKLIYIIVISRGWWIWRSCYVERYISLNGANSRRGKYENYVFQKIMSTWISFIQSYREVAIALECWWTWKDDCSPCLLSRRKKTFFFLSSWMPESKRERAQVDAFSRRKKTFLFLFLSVVLYELGVANTEFKSFMLIST